jgi:LuxR family transcriptional regulator, maltose regulon positive regulatory protein
VVRSELVDRLMRARDARVVLLAAGAGFGKTTLLAQWAERDGRPFAWVALDHADDDPAELVADITRALDAVGLCAEDEPLRPGTTDAPWAGTLARPWLAIAARTRPFVLVLDGVQVLRAPGCLALLAALVDNLPPASQLAIAGRGEPALPLARWSVQGDLLRIGPEHLAMTRQETRLLVGADLELTARELDALLQRTEGWVAGLCMAGIRLRERREGGPAAFGGHDRLVADYLRDEVLAPLDDDVARLMVGTSVLDRLSGPLCDAVLERSGSGAMLRDVARSTLFIQPLDGLRGWYRSHPLLREMLQAELHLQGTAVEVELHRRASAWHEAHGDPREAIRHARASGDADRAGDLVWASLLPLLCRGQLGTLARWLADFGDREIAAMPALAMAAAWCGLERGDVAAAGRWAATAVGAPHHRSLPGGPATFAAASAALRAATAGEGLTRMAEDAVLGRAGAGPASGWSALCGLIDGVARRLAGDPEGARASLAAAERDSIAASAPSPLVRSLAQLAALAAEADDWKEAAALVARAREAGERECLQDDAGMIEVCAVSALVLARLGQPADAARDARRCLRLLASQARVPPWLAVDARILLARASLLVGDASTSGLLLRDGRRALARMPDAGLLGSRLEEAWRRVEAFPLAGVIAPAPLSRAELRVLRFLPTHLSYREIGERLHVSQCTVKSQALSTYRKLDVSSRSQAVERAVALGLIQAADAPGPPRAVTG